jgi:mannose-6-phosphate isomerase-like protein (cupin superfamily)
MTPIQKVNLAEKFSLLRDYYAPRIVGQVNDIHVKLATIKGDFAWHHHEHEDELFLVVKGSLLMKLRTGDITVNEGEFIIIPRGVEHNPCAADECHILLVEPTGTLNTGNIRNEKTVENPATL